MRYTRLRRQIEGGTLIGTHGTPFAGGAEKIAEAMKKRKKGRSTIKSRSGSEGGEREEEGEEESSDVSPSVGFMGAKSDEGKGERDGCGGKDVGVKIEYVYGSGEDRDSTEDEDSDDDKPIAKRRGRFDRGGGGDAGMKISQPSLNGHGSPFQGASSSSSSSSPLSTNSNPHQIQRQYQYQHQNQRLPALNPFMTSDPEILLAGGRGGEQEQWQRLGLLPPGYRSLPLRRDMSLDEQRDWFSVAATGLGL